MQFFLPFFGYVVLRAGKKSAMTFGVLLAVSALLEKLQISFQLSETKLLGSIFLYLGFLVGLGYTLLKLTFSIL